MYCLAKKYTKSLFDCISHATSAPEESVELRPLRRRSFHGPLSSTIKDRRISHRTLYYEPETGLERVYVPSEFESRETGSLIDARESRVGVATPTIARCPSPMQESCETNSSGSWQPYYDAREYQAHSASSRTLEDESDEFQAAPSSPELLLPRLVLDPAALTSFMPSIDGDSRF